MSVWNITAQICPCKAMSQIADAEEVYSAISLCGYMCALVRIRLLRSDLAGKIWGKEPKVMSMLYYDLFLVCSICCFICVTMPVLGGSGTGGGGALGRMIGRWLFWIMKTWNLCCDYRIYIQMQFNHPTHPCSEQCWITCFSSSLCLLSRLDICSAVSDLIRSAGFVMWV